MQLEIVLFCCIVVLVHSQSDAGCKSSKKAVYTSKTGGKFMVEEAKIIDSNCTISKIHHISKRYKVKHVVKHVVKNGEITDAGYPAEIVSYSDGLNFPVDLAAELFDIGPSQAVYVPCNCDFKVGLKISGRWFWVSHSRLIVEWMPKKDGLCYTKMFSCPTNEYTIGGPFISQNCVLEDREGMIGFAERRKPNKNPKYGWL